MFIKVQLCTRIWWQRGLIAKDLGLCQESVPWGRTGRCVWQASHRIWDKFKLLPMACEAALCQALPTRWPVPSSLLSQHSPHSLFILPGTPFPPNLPSSPQCICSSGSSWVGCKVSCLSSLCYPSPFKFSSFYEHLFVPIILHLPYQSVSFVRVWTLSSLFTTASSVLHLVGAVHMCEKREMGAQTPVVQQGAC